MNFPFMNFSCVKSFYLLAVSGDGWHSLTAAMSEELFRGLKRWQAVYLTKNRSSSRLP